MGTCIPPPTFFFFTFKYFVPALVLFLSGFPKCVIVAVGGGDLDIKMFSPFLVPSPSTEPLVLPSSGIEAFGGLLLPFRCCQNS